MMSGSVAGGLALAAYESSPKQTKPCCRVKPALTRVL